MLSLALASDKGSISPGTRSSMASAHGTRSASLTIPPWRPNAWPKPKAASGLSPRAAAHLVVNPAAHGRQAPTRQCPRNNHEIADCKAPHVRAARDHLGDALMPVGEGSGERVGSRAAEGLVDRVHQRASSKEPFQIVPKKRSVPVAPRGNEGSHDRVGRRGQSGLLDVPPLEDFGSQECELAHRITVVWSPGQAVISWSRAELVLLANCPDPPRDASPTFLLTPLRAPSRCPVGPALRPVGGFRSPARIQSRPKGGICQ